MRAAQFARHGGLDVIDVVESSRPTPAPHEALLRVTASSVNAVDILHRNGALGPLTGKKFPQGLGIDAVGTLEHVGSDIHGFAVGDRVWGIRAGAAGMRQTTGLASEYAVLDGRRMSRAPDSLTDSEAAAFVVSGYTALRALRTVAHVRAGERLVVRGASGGVGSAGVQIGAALGAHVVALASSPNELLAKELGATEFLDYSVTSPSSIERPNVILDTAGTDLLHWRRRLAPGGRMVGVAFDSLATVATIGFSSIFGPRRIRSFAGEPPEGTLADLSSFVDKHRLRPVVHETYQLEDIAAAHQQFAARGFAGKLVITIQD